MSLTFCLTKIARPLAVRVTDGMAFDPKNKMSSMLSLGIVVMREISPRLLLVTDMVLVNAHRYRLRLEEINPCKPQVFRFARQSVR